MATKARKRARIKRDTAIVVFALTIGAVEVLFLGGRAGVLAWVTSLLLSPLVLRYDEVRRENGNGGSE